MIAIGALAAAGPASAASLQNFGRCVTRAGAIFYGASWCPHCRAQRETLGDAISTVRYVECSVDGDRHASTTACHAAHIDSYPTWVFADGSRADGELSLAALASRTGCSLTSASGGSSGAPATNPDRARKPSGPKIIEIPRE